jgi:eukaryotic-like serine/threonine-protein kinase
LDELQADDPRRIGTYTLLARLGSGGMGQVYFGRSLGGRDVAVKVIHADLAKDQSFRLRFAREVETARRVGGAFTAPVIDADPEAPIPWLVTGYVNGPSLADAIERHGPLPVSSVLALAAGLAEGLSTVHGVGVIHRDLKPANVLLAQDGPRLIDFGISQAADFAQITSTGMAVGTPGFMSPEQILGDQVGPSSDIFTMGAVLAFAATGEQPFGIGPPDVRNQRVLYLAPRLDNLPGELRPLVERCMARDPADRPTAGQFLADLVATHPEAADQANWLPEYILAEDDGRRIPVPPPGRETPPQHEKTTALDRKAAPPERETPASDLGADRTRTSTSTPPPAVSHASAGKPPWKPWTSQRRRIGAIGAVAAVAALGMVIGLLVALPGSPWAQSARLASAALPQPTGLSAVKAMETSITLGWKADASGSRPGKYEILENGINLVSVPGRQTKYEVTGLRENTGYQFSVIAVSGTSHSAPSATISADTTAPPRPPLADAAFNWFGTVNYKETASSDSFFKAVGATWQDVWTIRSNCGERACPATLDGTINGIGFSATLARSGATYTGSAAIDNYWLDCLNTSHYENTTLSIRLTGTHEGTSGGEGWSIAAFTGTLTWDVPALPDGCAGSLYQMQVQSSTS